MADNETTFECKVCKGTGELDTIYFLFDVKTNDFISNNYKCDRCDGTGELDWVSNVMRNVA